MKSPIVAMLLGLAATTFAAAVPDEVSSFAKRNTEVEVTLCNDFHGGKPCQTYDAWPGVCKNVDSTNAGYISSVKIPQSNENCTFYNEYNCDKGAKHITVSYPGNVDLAVNYNFDNQVLSYSCQTSY